MACSQDKTYVDFQQKNVLETLPRKAVGDMIPVRFATSTVVPDSRNGAVKSTAASLSAFTLSEVSTMSNFLSTRAFISPFHFPFCRKKSGKGFVRVP